MSKEMLVTSQGMIARHIDKTLTEKGFSVDVTTSEISRVSKKDGIYHFDKTDPESIYKLVSQGYKAIIDMSGIADPRVAQKDPGYADKVNHTGVIEMLEAVKKLPESKRPVVILACSVLQFDIRESGVISVDHKLKDSSDPYISSKNRMLLDSLPYLNDGLDIRFAFIANTTGEGHSLGYFPTDMADQIVRGEKIKHGPLDHKRPFLHAKDAGNIFYYALTRLSGGERFLVSGKESVSLRSFLDTMIKVSNSEDLSDYRDESLGKDSPIKDINFDTSKIESLGYRQIHGIPDICRTLLTDRVRVLKGISLPVRGIRGY